MTILFGHQHSQRPNKIVIRLAVGPERSVVEGPAVSLLFRRIEFPSAHVSSRRILRWALPLRMQGFQEADQRRYFRRGKILSVGRHVSASLQHLVYQLVVGQPGSHVIELRTALTAQATDHVTISSLLFLKDNLALPPQRC